MIKSQKIYLSVITTVLPVCSLNAIAANPTGDCLRKSIKLAFNDSRETHETWPDKPFEPFALLRAKGLTPSKIFFDFYRKNNGSPFSTMIVSYEGQPIQRTHLRAEKIERVAIPSTGKLPLQHPVHGSLRGRGIGTLGYMVAARTLFKESGLVLRSDLIPDDLSEGMVSEDAMKLWSRLNESGWARKLRCIFGSCVEFKKEVLQSHLFDPVDYFCQTQCRYHDGEPPAP